VYFRESLFGLVSLSKLSILVLPVGRKKVLKAKCDCPYRGGRPCIQCCLNRWNELIGFDPYFGESIRSRPRPKLWSDVRADNTQARKYLARNKPVIAFELPRTLEGSDLSTISLADFSLVGLSAMFGVVKGDSVFLVAQTSKGKLSEADMTELEAASKDLMKSTGPEYMSPEGFNEDDLLTVEQLSGYLGLQPASIRNKVSRRELPFVKIGSACRFRWGDIKRWIKENTFTVGAEKENDVSKYPWE
jgi:excisionase family DNA binding protein